MLPTINGKSFLECTEQDLQELLGNSAYRENEHIDYKEAFTISSYPKGDSRRDKSIAELRSDVCSFANTDGGYLIFGIQEDGEGVAKELIGIPVENKDKFELELNNWLQSIMPRIPNYKIKFIPLSNGQYVIILSIVHDFFAPYIHLVGDKDYRIYKRVGNSKKTITYSELKNMFTQSISLEREIDRIRKERQESFIPEGRCFSYSFMLLHIFPETFMDSSYNLPLIVLERKGTAFKNVFDDFQCGYMSFPTVEGIRFSGYQIDATCQLFNNGVAEAERYIEKWLDRNSETFPNGFLPWAKIWEMIAGTIKKYAQIMGNKLSTHKTYIGFSLFGCKNVMSYRGDFHDESAYIDRDKLLMNTMVFEDITNQDTLERDLKKMKLDYLLALGISRGKEIHALIQDLYDK